MRPSDTCDIFPLPISWIFSVTPPPEAREVRTKMSRFRILITMTAFSLLTVFLAADPAQAQLLGANTLGDYGLQSATQPPPRLYPGGHVLSLQRE